MRTYAILKVIDALQVKNKVSARSDIRECELSLVLLDLLESVFNQYLVLHFQICCHLNFEFVSRFLNLHLDE
jgi:hypothetical protein